MLNHCLFAIDSSSAALITADYKPWSAVYCWCNRIGMAQFSKNFLLDFLVFYRRKTFPYIPCISLGQINNIKLTFKWFTILLLYIYLSLKKLNCIIVHIIFSKLKLMNKTLIAILATSLTKLPIQHRTIYIHDNCCNKPRSEYTRVGLHQHLYDSNLVLGFNPQYSFQKVMS